MAESETSSLDEKGLVLLKTFQWVGYSMIVGVLAFLQYSSLNHKIEMILSGGPYAFLSVLQICMMIFVVLYLLGWVIWTATELQLCEQNLKWLPPIPTGVFYVILLGGAGLGLLGYLYDRIIPFAIAFGFIDVLSRRGTHIFDEGIALAIKKTRQLGEIELNANAFKRDILNAIEEYYVNKPQELRLILRFCVTLLVLVLGIIGHLPNLSSHNLTGLLEDSPSIGNYLAYLTMLIAAFVSEGIITAWRVNRGRRVRRAQIGEAFSI